MTQTAERWSLPKRAAFRFAFAYLVLYNFPPHGVYIHWLWRPIAFVQKGWLAFVPWVGRHFLGVDASAPAYYGASGDRTFDYVKLLCVFVLSAAAALVWSAADRKRPHYRRMFDWLRVLVRYVVAVNMVGYGMAKLFKTQFPDLGAYSLMRTYGNSSPMGLLWNFMGFSAGYNIFTGAGEFLGGALLFFRQTTTLGALIVIAVMSNVAMLNFCYDVPVKLFSTHLLAMAVFLVLPEAKRLADVLIFNRVDPPFGDARMNLAARAVKAAFIASILYFGAVGQWSRSRGEGARDARYALRGMYQVEHFTSAKGRSSPAALDAQNWRLLKVDDYGDLFVKLADESSKKYRITEDWRQKLVEISNGSGTTRLNFSYFKPDAAHVTLEAGSGREAMTIRLAPYEEPKPPLLTRGFHWISETPYNR